MKKEKRQGLPNNYHPTLPRVSDIVEYLYPFTGTPSELYFDRWLAERGIDKVEYMKVSSEGGTYVHAQLERYLNGKAVSSKPSPYDSIIISGIEAIENLGIIAVETEFYFCTDEYQGTIDVIGIFKDKNNKIWIIDFKTYNLAKQKFGLSSGVYKKPTEKLKKATVQLSLYAYARGVKNIGVLELTDETYYFHPLKLMSEKEIRKILDSYKKERLGGGIT